jgi:hypothetical protein
MAGWTTPHLLSEGWVWLVISLPLLLAVLAIDYFRRGAPPPLKRHPFFVRHKKAIRLVSDISIICLVSALAAFVAWVSVRDVSSLPAADGAVRQTELHFDWVVFSSGMVVASAWGTFLVGMLSVFQSNITTLKRIVLLVLCLLPAVFAVGSLSVASSELGWRTVPVGVLFCVPSWLVNGPAVLTGQPFLRVMWWVMRRLRMVSGDYPEWW